MHLFEEVSADYRKVRECEGYQPKHPEMLEKYGEASYFEKNRSRYEYRYYKICLSCMWVDAEDSLELW